MEGVQFTWWGPGQGVWGTEVSPKWVPRAIIPGIGGLGDEVP